jgi:ubiquinone/menaquinone biosynthesis C-methylase UbiE
MKITHSYEGLGSEYLKARKGTQRFAEFIVKNMGFDENQASLPLTMVELGVGSGQQTELIEKALLDRGITRYKILALDKSQRLNPADHPGQLDILKERISRGEISQRVTPVHFDFDGNNLPLESASIDLVYTANVIHHLAEKQKVFGEIARIMRGGSRFFNLGVAIEHLKDHPLDEFFPEKFEYDARRYPTEAGMRDLFRTAGITCEKPVQIGQDNNFRIDREFLANIENTTIDSVLQMIKDEDPGAFARGVERVKRAVEQAETTASYRHYHCGAGRIFWGIRQH